MQEDKNTNTPANRVQNHREQAVLSGLKRVEVKVSIKDEWFIRALAKALRSNKEKAELIRNELSELLSPPSTQGIADFFHSSPLSDVAQSLELERSKETGTPLQF